MSYIGNQPTQAQFFVDTFSGNGSSKTFTTSIAAASSASAIVAISGVVQDPSVYSFSGTTLTFASAPSNGVSNISVRYLGIPVSGISQQTYRTVTEFTATAGQTTFTVPSYTVGYVDVYRNGVQLASADYTATSGVTIVLTQAANLNDLVRVVALYNTQITNALPTSGGTVTGALALTSTTASTSNTTGALVVTGGAGITGNVFIGGNLSVAGNTIIENTYVNTLTISTTDTVAIQNTTASTSNTTGALTVTGGAGISGNLWVGTGIVTQTLTTPTGSSANLIIDPDGLGDVVFPINTEIFVQSTAVANSTTSGALQVSGGVGVVGNVYAGGIITSAGGIINTSLANTSITNIFENMNVSSTSVNANVNIDILNNAVVYNTGNTANNWTTNFRGNSTTTLNSIMAVGQSATVAHLVTNNASAYYANTWQVDGASITPKWQGGSAPTSGNASSVDIYSYTIVKTGAATFSLFASQTQFK